jgi:serine/threonine protein phosphatase PrpC
MDFLRRLLGPRPDQTTEHKTTGGPAPEITAPGVSVNTTAPAAVVQAPTKRTPEEIAEAAMIDPTPIVPLGGTRQLPPIESMVTKPGKHAIYGLNSDIGMIRNNNQDSLFAFFSANISVEGQPDFALFIVADGMGGHHDGERASAITTRTIGKFVVEKFYLDLLQKGGDQDADRPVLSEVLSEAVQKANENVAEEIPEGGTTVTAAAILSDRVFIAHVGDSRAYMITTDGIEQVTRDHSLVQRLIELDKLTPEEALAHPQRNVLYRAIGQSEDLEVDAVTRRLPAGAKLLLCSDGLWNQVSEANLLRIVQAAKTPQEACDQLITIANDSGGPDNITVILVQVPG